MRSSRRILVPLLLAALAVSCTPEAERSGPTPHPAGTGSPRSDLPANPYPGVAGSAWSECYVAGAFGPAAVRDFAGQVGAPKGASLRQIAEAFSRRFGDASREIRRRTARACADGLRAGLEESPAG